MAVLNDAQRTQLHADLMRVMSANRTPTDNLVKADIRSIVNAMDDALDTAETSVVTAFSPGSDIRNYLTSRPSVGRRGLELVEKFRRENL